MQLPKDEVLEKSRIFKKGNNGTLTNYQQVINDAAYELCLENPSLINNKGELLNLSRVKLMKTDMSIRRKEVDHWHLVLQRRKAKKRKARFQLKFGISEFKTCQRTLTA